MEMDGILNNCYKEIEAETQEQLKKNCLMWFHAWFF